VWLRDSRGGSRKYGPRRRLGIDRIGLASQTTYLPSGAVHFEHFETLAAQKRGHGDAVQTGSFYADPNHETNRRNQCSRVL